VDRSNSKSRLEVYGRAQKRLNQGLSICIFPEGKVPEEHIILDEFKDGAFRLALEHQIPIVPMTFFDNKERLSYTFFSGSMGIMRVKIHEFIETAFLDLVSKKSLKDKAYSIILKDLEDDLIKKSPK
jgi:1-acyl-sn-glycerol-3-phosphate acyltransferase